MITLISCIGLDYDSQLLPHFIRHYSKLDIDHFHFILHSKSEFDTAAYENMLPNLTLEKWVGNFDGVTKTVKLNKVIESVNTEYVMMADVDEFQIWETSVKEYLKVNEFRWGLLRDRESVDKKLVKVTNEDLHKQFPLITNRTTWSNLYKPCVFSSTDRLISPHHVMFAKNDFRDIIPIDHYRWIDGRMKKTKERKEHYSKLNQSGYNLESSPWNSIPNWEGDYILRMYKTGSLI